MMNTTQSFFVIEKYYDGLQHQLIMAFKNVLKTMIMLGFTMSSDLNFAQSIVRLTNFGTNDWLFHNSVSDNLGNTYYCTRDDRFNNSLNVTSISKEFLIQWSFNYNIESIEPVSGINYLNGNLYITSASNNNAIILVLDLSGNVVSSKRVLTSDATFASTVLHNNDIVLTTSYNPTFGSVQITRLTPGFTTVFNKRIQFVNRDQIYISHIKQIGNRIYFGGSARTIGNIKFYWFFGALELNGTLGFLNEYEVDNSDLFPNNHFMSMDSVSQDIIITSGYTGDSKSTGNFDTYADGLLVKFNAHNGSVLDHLIISPQLDDDWMYFLGVKYQANKIRVCGAKGSNNDFEQKELLFGEVDLDFNNYQFKFSTTQGIHTWLTKFIDFEHVSGKLLGEPIIMTEQGKGRCTSSNACFSEGQVISLSKTFNPVHNSYTLTDINYDVENLVVQRKAMPITLTASCGISSCEESHVTHICKQHYTYDYSAIQQNPGPVNNLTPNIANLIHDRINKKLIIDPIQAGTALILMETQINLFLIQIDTFKFVIINDSLPTLDLGPDKVLCNGDSAILSYGLDSTLWSDGSMRKSIVVKTAGVYFGSYTNSCGTASDTIIITTQQFPKLNLGNDLLLCGNASGTLISNYDNTIWNNGGRGRSIVVTTPGKIVGFVSTPCGVSFDTIEVFKFERTSFSAGPDQEICDPETMLAASFLNPNAILFSSEIEWKQIDQLPLATFNDTRILNPFITNLSKDQNHFFELNIRLGATCILKDTIKIFSRTCFIDSCAFIIERNCLPTGMVELRAIDANGQTIIPKNRVHEFFWDIKDGPAGRGYSLTNKNPVVVSNHTRYCLTSKLYSWKQGRPHTIEYADICQLKSCDSLSLNCTGPCEDFSFILSSCLDDYDEENNLNFPNEFCKSVCVNNCDFIVGIFGLDGNLVDPNFYNVKWSSGETGATSMQKGCINYTLAVEVRRGDCVWYGRYRESCKGLNGGFSNDQYGLIKNGPSVIDLQSLHILLDAKQEFVIYNMNGQYLGKESAVFDQLTPGVYYIITSAGNKELINKIVVTGN